MVTGFAITKIGSCQQLIVYNVCSSVLWYNVYNNNDNNRIISITMMLVNLYNVCLVINILGGFFFVIIMALKMLIYSRKRRMLTCTCTLME